MAYKDKEKQRATERAYREANREKHRAWLIANREKLNAQARARRAANPEKALAYKRVYYAANQEKLRARARGYYKPRPPKAKIPVKQHPLYRRWSSMRSRCKYPTAIGYRHYGGRGIKVCDAWQTFAGFLADMEATYRPGLTLERIDNNGDYTPENCRWATPWEQNRNQRYNVYVETPWGKLLLRDAAAKSGIKYQTLWVRHRKHQPLFSPTRHNVSKAQQA